jgi:hypothetical protein
MGAQRSFAVKSLLSCLIFITLLAGAFFYMARLVLQGLHQYIDPFLSGTGPALPEDAQLAFANLNQWVLRMEHALPFVLFGVALLVACILWLFILGHGRRLARGLDQTGVKQTASSPELTGLTAAEKPAETAPLQLPGDTAVQMLALFQREGRLIDFLEENLSGYEDAQIGAAVRSIHAGCKRTLAEHFELQAVLAETEGATVTIPPGFDARAIRLTGNVSGDPPFQGTLRHRGWRVARMDLPEPSAGRGGEWIVTPAEVEIS